jgi:hypothetical protein
LQRAGLLGAAAALSEFVVLADVCGVTAAASDSVTEDTFKGVVAFMVPGDDAYSVAQGETVAGPGGIASGVVPFLIATIDRGIHGSFGGVGAGVPVSQGIAALLNQTALTVDPAAANGGFLSPFARLSFAQKGQVFARLDEEGRDNTVGLVAAALTALTALMCYSEVAVYDPTSRRLERRPVGWTMSGYGGVVEGRAEFRGYWRGRTAADPGSPACEATQPRRHKPTRCKPTRRRRRRRRPRRRRHRLRRHRGPACRVRFRHRRRRARRRRRRG